MGTIDRDTLRKVHTLKCSHCELLRINGVVCHEIGCPNINARWDAARGEWVKQRRCMECGNRVDADDPCCDAVPEYGYGGHYDADIDVI